jgi:hypothetical protein
MITLVTLAVWLIIIYILGICDIEEAKNMVKLPKHYRLSHVREDGTFVMVRSDKPVQDIEEIVETPDWDCGSGQCDPNTGCPSCSDEDRVWMRAR